MRSATCLCWELQEGEDLSLGVFVPQLLAQSLALSTVQETFNTPNPSPSLCPLAVTVSCWIAVWWRREARTRVE